MAATLAPVEREEKKWQAYGLSLRGQHYAGIARVLKISERTTGTLIREAYGDVAKQRAAAGIPDLEKYLAEQDAVIAECWKELANTRNNSLNKSAILGTISTAYERKAKALGLLKDRQQIDVSIDLAAELRDLMKTTVRLEIAAPQRSLDDHGSGDAP